MCPGKVSTELGANSRADHRPGRRVGPAPAPAERLDVPMSRAADPAEIAAAVAFLCSEEASFITGVALPVDGGFTAI